ncbi:MAG: PHP domain-containing protein [Oscillospiraceae bacterium]|nr:PHP domain-containing protein [Oscillospiraceae bacterium]
MKYHIDCEIHMHTLASGHAYGSPREMAQAAAEQGLSLIGLSDHGPGCPGTCSHVFFGCYDRMCRNVHGVEILGGAELNVMNDGSINFPEHYFDYLDYAIVGIHPPVYVDEGAERNTDNTISCMKHPKVFFVSHPDSNKFPYNYERLVPAAKELGVALEVNTSSLRAPQKRPGCVENYKTMLKLCMEHRFPIVVSTYSHDPCEVGHFEETLALLEELNFDEELIVNTSKEKLLAFIGKK